MEKVLKAIIDETLRTLRDDLNAPQLSVFIRRIWNSIFPVCGRTVEKYIVKYDAENKQYFACSDPDLVGTCDRLIEQLSKLDEEILATRSEIESWQKLSSVGDERMHNFKSMKRNFSRELSRIDDSSSSTFIEGGFAPIPQLAPWEHPETRDRNRIMSIFVSEMEDALASAIGTFKISNGCGIPVGSYCFDPAAEIADAWNTPLYEEWDAELEGDVPVVVTEGSPLPSPVADLTAKKNSNSHRLSIDALRAFE
jgi:hypothetical protein